MSLCNTPKSLWKITSENSAIIYITFEKSWSVVFVLTSTFAIYYRTVRIYVWQSKDRNFNLIVSSLDIRWRISRIKCYILFTIFQSLCSPCKVVIPMSCINSSSGLERIIFHYLELDNRHNIDYNLRQGCQKRITMCHKNCWTFMKLD